jgi:heterotetrameric sarcosine oxidase delta subunit
MRIRCPHCGERPLEEFTYLGDATPKRPESNDLSSLDQWFEYVYLRDNRNGEMFEYWHHSGGCRSWLVAMRDTGTHEFHSTLTAREFARRGSR